MEICVVVPTYNEASNLEGLVDRLIALPFRSLGVLVVDDNSPDGTGQIADRLAGLHPDQVHVLHRVDKRGLGSAYLDGFRMSIQMEVDMVAQMDADFSHPPELLLMMAEEIGAYDLVLGSRYIEGGGVDENWPYWRKALSAFGNFYARTILRIPIRDLTGGFKLWKSSTLRHLPLDRIRSNGYAFQVEMTYLAYRMGCKILEIPFYFPDREKGESKMSFAIQREAAVRTWQILREYRDLKRGS